MLMNEEKINVTGKKKRPSNGQPLFYIGLIKIFLHMK